MTTACVLTTFVSVAYAVDADWYLERGKSYRALEQGRYAEALDMANSLLAEVKEEGKGPTEELSSIYIHVGMIYFSQGLYTKAQPHFEKALQTDERLFGKEGERLVDAIMYVAGNQAKQRQFSPSEANYLRAIDILGKKGDSIHLLLPLRALANLYHAQRRYDDAERMVHRALGAWKASLLPGDRGVTHELQNLGALFAARGDIKQAIVLHEQALTRLLDELASTQHPGNGQYARTVECLNRLGSLHRMSGNVQAAERVTSKGAELKNQMTGQAFEMTNAWAQSLLTLP